ncbi:Fe-Mn family superoxide dismutase [Candidatus Nomurabacteria bacterium]|nr:Fe-Mn family superoxide dismutase [Candidatus Nomurabacteria bacterium]
MEIFTPKTFVIPELTGIGAKNIEEHLKLYKGYVTNANLILEKINTLSEDAENNAYIIAELRRRFPFEFDGMRNHEYYFSQFEGEHTPVSDSKLKEKIAQTWGSFDSWLEQFKAIAMTRGIGWAVLYYDDKTDKLLQTWVDEQHLGQLIGLKPILALDMWEHAYVYDYPTSEKKKYVEAFFANINWKVVEDRF